MKLIDIPPGSLVRRTGTTEWGTLLCQPIDTPAGIQAAVYIGNGLQRVTEQDWDAGLWQWTSDGHAWRDHRAAWLDLPNGVERRDA